MLRLRLKVLGGFEARIGPGEPLDIATRKTRALLAYLALPPGRAHARDKLTGLLWSDRGDEQARNSLRQALTELGRILAGIEPSPLVKGRDTLSLDPEVVEVDAMLFDRLAASPDVGDLRRAAAMYAGDLLDGFGVRDPAFEEWLRDERQRYRELSIATLKKARDLPNGRERFGGRPAAAGAGSVAGGSPPHRNAAPRRSGRHCGSLASIRHLLRDAEART